MIMEKSIQISTINFFLLLLMEKNKSRTKLIILYIRLMRVKNFKICLSNNIFYLKKSASKSYDLVQIYYIKCKSIKQLYKQQS